MTRSSALLLENETEDQYKARALSGGCEIFNEIQNQVVAKAIKENRTDFQNLYKEIFVSNVQEFYNPVFENIPYLASKADEYFKKKFKRAQDDTRRVKLNMGTIRKSMSVKGY